MVGSCRRSYADCQSGNPCICPGHLLTSHRISTIMGREQRRRYRFFIAHRTYDYTSYHTSLNLNKYLLPPLLPASQACPAVSSTFLETEAPPAGCVHTFGRGATFIQIVIQIDQGMLHHHNPGERCRQRGAMRCTAGSFAPLGMQPPV